LPQNWPGGKKISELQKFYEAARSSFVDAPLGAAGSEPVV
jgi:hypothetical protein